MVKQSSLIETAKAELLKTLMIQRGDTRKKQAKKVIYKLSILINNQELLGVIGEK